MSSAIDPDAAAWAAFYNSTYTLQYFGLAAAVLFFLDAIITFDREVACFRAAKWSGAAFLFLANKGISLMYYVMVLVDFGPFPSDKASNLCFKVCTLFVYTSFAMEILQMIPWAVFSALRAYALTGGSVSLGVLVCVLSVAPVGVNLVKYKFHISGANSPPFGCLLDVSNPIGVDGLRFVVAARVPLIVADVLLIYITWTKLGSWAILRQGLRRTGWPSLTYVVVRDGTIYFVLLFMLNMLHVIFTVLSVAVNVDNESNITAFTGPLTAILMSRFLLEIQEANQITVKVDSDDPLHLSNSDRPSFVQSLGAAINPDLSPADLDEDLAWETDMQPDTNPSPGLEGDSEEGELPSQVAGPLS